MRNANPVMDAAAIADGTTAMLHRVLEVSGVLAALRLINSRAPHRYTGIYRYTPEILENVYLVDAFDPLVCKGANVRNEDAYCLLLPKTGQLAFGQAEHAPDSIKLSPVVSYCGVLLTRANGEPFGSLCHFDVARCQEPATQMPCLEAMAPEIMAKLESEGY